MSQSFCWVVDDYLDQVKRKTEKESCETWIDGKTPRWKRVFESERAAQLFIILRASERVKEAEKKLIREKVRERRVLTKFGSVVSKGKDA